MEETKGKALKKELFYKTENLWDHLTEDGKAEVMAFNEDYKVALDKGKTERGFFKLSKEALEAVGFKDLSQYDRLKAGDKVYRSVRDKGLVALIVGQEDPAKGLRLVGSHIDSPRIDLKPNSLYEQNEMVLMKTHYYGGIKKYHWVASQLALHGVVILKDGKTVEVTVGEDASDPVFTITDLLPHLGKDQMQKRASEVISGEGLNLLVGSIPYPEKDLDKRFKLAILALLNERYGITERELISAELEVVPANKAKDVGFDRSFIGGYGQDDHVCAYTSLKALLDAKATASSFGILLFDKEEVGSDGNTGAQSKAYRHALTEIQAKIYGRSPDLLEAQALLENSKLLSSDVSNALDPNYPEVSDPMNAAYAGHGISLSKYTGVRGKGGTSDANAEFFSEVVRLFDAAKIPWQCGELGKVDQGGGGTIAMYFANDSMQVIDCGVPVFSMHSCFEIASKVDVFYTYKAYKAFMMG